MSARFFVLLLCAFTFTVYGCATTASGPKTAKDPKEVESGSYFSMGLIDMNHERWDKAEKNFLEALKINPKGYNTRLYLAKVYQKEGKPDEAVEQLRDAIKQNSKNSAAYAMLLDFYLGSGQTDKAIAAGEEAIQNGAGTDAILTNLGWAYYVSGDNVKAKARLTAALENSKNDTFLYNNLGLVNFSDGRYEDALSNFKESDKINPQSHVAPYFLALTYKKLGKEGEALTALEAGLKKDPQLKSKVQGYNKYFFPHTADPGDLSALFDKAKVEAPVK